MAKTCSRCGSTLSFVERLGQDLCEQCRTAAYAEADAAAAVRAEAAERERQEAASERHARAKEGEVTEAEAEVLKSDGYVVVGGRLLSCPVCGNDKFQQQRALLNTRGATFLGLDWSDRGAEANICLSCRHIVWFARE